MARAMSEEDIQERARDYVERLKVDSLAKAPQHQRAAMAAYWQSRAGMFRALAKMVIKAELADRDEADALAWSVGEFGKDLNRRAATGAQFREYQRWAGERAGFLRTIAREIWRLILRDRRNEPAQPTTNQSFKEPAAQLTTNHREEPPNDGFYVALEAHPNEDYDAGNYLGRVRIPLQWQAVMSLEDATKKVRRYIESHGLGSGNWVGRAGQVARYGKPWVHISYNGRIWQGWDPLSKTEVDFAGVPMPALDWTEPVQPTTNQSFKVEVLAHGGWSSNAQRYETEEQAKAAGESLFSRWTAVEQYRVVPSTDPPNQPKPETPAVPPPPSAPPPDTTASDQRILFVHVGDKPRKPPTPQLPPPLPMEAYVRSPQPTPQTQVMEEEVLRYSVEIRGQWGKRRRDDFISVVLAKRIDPKKPLPLDTLLTMMRNKLAELKVKPGAVIKLVEQPWTVRSDGIERTSLLSGRTVHTETVK
jgi:hypothetical protein